MPQQTEPRDYASPKLTNLGSLETVTQGNKTGGYLDKSFPVHTPKGKLTFS
jgi:hypothetical protein